MNKRKNFISLNLKITVAILVGMLLAACMYVACIWFENYVTTVRFTSDEAVERNIGEAYDDLQEYVDRYDIEATDSKALSKWMKKQAYTYLYVYDNHQVYFESGWWSDPTAENPNEKIQEENSQLYETDKNTDGPRIDKEEFYRDIADTKNRIVSFKDGEYYAFLDQYEEQHWHQLMNLVTMCLCFLTLLITILVYNGRMLKRIILLSSEVKQVSNGAWDYPVRILKNDEIGELAEGVDNMRTAIIRKHKNEKAAWEANTQLITAMSHDIRTPLTSLIGYLDIIEGKKYEDEEQLNRYISSCREKAFQLKDLSDKLFQYFLVFGKNENERVLERYDASILFQQLLSEHCAEIIGYGYRVYFQCVIPEVDVLIDLSGARRLFDNIFSNIMKYAEKQEVIRVSAETDDKELRIIISNKISSTAKKVESTRIGLKTCEKICADMKGTFEYEEEEFFFTAKVTLPIAPPEEKTEEPEAEEPAEKQ